MPLVHLGGLEVEPEGDTRRGRDRVRRRTRLRFERDRAALRHRRGENEGVAAPTLKGAAAARAFQHQVIAGEGALCKIVDMRLEPF